MRWQSWRMEWWKKSLQIEKPRVQVCSSWSAVVCGDSRSREWKFSHEGILMKRVGRNRLIEVGITEYTRWVLRKMQILQDLLAYISVTFWILRLSKPRSEKGRKCLPELGSLTIKYAMASNTTAIVRAIATNLRMLAHVNTIVPTNKV